MTPSPQRTSIDLNADLGEGAPHDGALYELISSASIACGGHAGDEATMRAALHACAHHGVAAGAHPGFPDREGFGRRRLDWPVPAITGETLAQIERLAAIAARQSVPLRYVKLHGALHNMASEDDELAHALFSAIADRFPALAILAMAGTAQERAARALGLRVVTEAYADRGYLASGLLAPRGTQGAELTDPDYVAARCLRLAQTGIIEAVDGTPIRSDAQSVCLHGDSVHALTLARHVHRALSHWGEIVSPLR